jgi:hypothetical protein
MANTNNMPQNAENALYIDVKRFTEAKQALKAEGKDCTDRKLSEILSCNLRTVQKYRSATNQFPIPPLRLQRLAEYMDVSPDWLCGKHTPGLLAGVGYKDMIAIREIIRKETRTESLVEYLKAREIVKGDATIYGIQWDENGCVEISGIPVDYKQFLSYLDELESGIQYITDRFTAHIKN